MFGVTYLSEEQLKGFDRYKYNSVDKSWFSNHVMHPFWNWCVEYFPRWLAPNLITFIGFILTIFNFFLISYYDYHFDAGDQEINPIPRWVWMVAAINLFIAYTLDGIDGKQARRTGTSTPLGELFDHGLDSYSTTIIHIYMFSLFGRTTLPPSHMFFIIINATINFYLTHFEKYNTGVMFLPIAYDYVMCSVCGALALTSLIGPWIWTRTYFGIMPRKFFEVVLYTSGPITSHWVTILNIYKSYKNKTGKMRPFWEAVRPLIPLLLMIFICTTWVLLSPNNIIDLEPRMFLILTGTIFSNICCRLIVAQMSDTIADRCNLFLWPTLLATITCVSPNFLGFNSVTSQGERYILWGLSSVITLAHLHYATGVVCEMADHFKIRVFKVSKSSKFVVNCEDIDVINSVSNGKPTTNNNQTPATNNGRRTESEKKSL